MNLSENKMWAAGGAAHKIYCAAVGVFPGKERGSRGAAGNRHWFHSAKDPWSMAEDR
jgi:hypothetical protein